MKQSFDQNSCLKHLRNDRKVKMDTLGPHNLGSVD